MISSLKLHASMVVGSAILFLLVFLANVTLFRSEIFDVVPGISWIYLPAGMRLVCTLLFGGAGAIGVLIASWITGVFYVFPDDPVHSFSGAVASATAPYLVYKIAQRLYGLEYSLANLNGRRLLVLSIAYSVASPTLHHLWMLWRGEPVTAAYFVMIIGDLLGTLAVIYTMKLILTFVPMPAPPSQNRQL